MDFQIGVVTHLLFAMLRATFAPKSAFNSCRCYCRFVTDVIASLHGKKSAALDSGSA